MPPPTRTRNDQYHYHVYDYDGSAAKGPWELSLGQPRHSGWQFYSMVQDLQGLRDYGAGTTHVPNIQLTYPGNQIGIGPTSKRTMLLSFGSNDQAAPVVLITGGIHAREWVATEFAYLLAEYLVMHYATDPGTNKYKQALKALIDSRRIRIIPMLNPAGNWFTVFGDAPGARNWRKNRRALPGAASTWVQKLTRAAGQARVPNPPFEVVGEEPPPSELARYNVPTYTSTTPPHRAQFLTRTLAIRQTGVDLNRNVDTAAWGYDAATHRLRPNYDPAKDTYFGPDRASETETGNLQTVMAAAGPATAIDYHSFGKFILFPSEAFDRGRVDDNYKTLGRTVHELIRAQGVNAPDYRLGTPLDLVKYSATGTVTDRTSQLYQTRGFTIELDPADEAGGGFNLDETKIRMVFEKNIRAVLAAIAAPAPTGDAAAQNIAITQAGLSYAGWQVYGRGNRLPA